MLASASGIPSIYKKLIANFSLKNDMAESFFDAIQASDFVTDVIQQLSRFAQLFLLACRIDR